MSAQLDLGFSPGANRVSYWNTTGLRGEELDTAKVAAGKQDEQVLAIFQRRARTLTPSEVWRFGCDGGSRWLLTSVRRSIHSLTRDGLLVHLEDRRMGLYGKPEGLWQLREGNARD